MTDPDLTPEQDADVRRLLARARHDAPIPADVAQRLDRVLDQLGEGDDPAPVVDLAAHRRRRTTAARLLVAAAAVVVGGFGVAHLSGHGADSDNANDSRVSGQVARSEGGASAASSDSAPDSSFQAGTTAPSSTVPGPATPFEKFKSRLPVRLHAARLATDVAAIGQEARGAAAADQLNAELVTGAEPDGVPSYACAGGDYGAGTLLPALYDGTPAVLALRPAQAGQQTAEVLECGSARVLASVVVPAS